MTEKQYSEYGYRGLEEIKAKDKEIKKLKKEISDLKSQLQLQENQTNKYSAIAHLPNY
jgi:cell shape-determining protein MreC